ncbi:hypothetical protein [Methyloraptor flagellatus]|uniref:AMIN domain-containing protein n=1 Tax=Methyloraptor flagellatus TaxID=3162530 RepID=A0AAU7XAW2_9HYPH
MILSTMRSRRFARPLVSRRPRADVVLRAASILLVIMELGGFGSLGASAARGQELRLPTNNGVGLDTGLGGAGRINNRVMIPRITDMVPPSSPAFDIPAPLSPTPSPGATRAVAPPAGTAAQAPPVRRLLVDAGAVGIVNATGVDLYLASPDIQAGTIALKPDEIKVLQPVKAAQNYVAEYRFSGETVQLLLRPGVANTVRLSADRRRLEVVQAP